jgi:hypothetical protein
MQMLTQAEIDLARVRSMAHIFQRADRILTGGQVTCEIVDHPFIQAPAYSQADAISFNLPHMGSVKTTDDIIKLRGLNFHELAHVMFTPREDESDVVVEIRERGYHGTFNLLEDQRIETLLTALYPSIRPYFTSIFVNYCLADRSNWKTAHALAHGRRFLPKKIRDELRKRFMSQEHVDQVSDLIDRYRQIVWPRDEEEAFDIIREFQKLMRNVQPPQDPYGHGSGTRPEVNQGGEGSYGEEDQDAAQEWARDADEDEEEDEDETSGGGKSDKDEDDTEDDEEGDTDAGEQGEGDIDDESDDDAEGDGDEDDDTEGSGDEEGDESEQDADDEGDEGKSSSGAGGAGHKLPDTELEDLLEETRDESVNDREVQQEVRDTERSIKEGIGHAPALDLADYREVVPGRDYFMASNGFKKELQRLVTDADPGWKRYQPSGRINVQRAMRGEDIETVFDSWDEGQQHATDIELVIMFDYSPSMQWMLSHACKSMWAIKRAVEAVGGDVTVMGFDFGAVTMYTRKDKAKRDKARLFGTGSGTDPSEAIEQAKVIFHGSRRTHKIALFITDGSWHNQRRGEAGIQELHKHGIMTALAFLKDKPGGTSRRLQEATLRSNPFDLFHGCQVAQAVDAPVDMITLARQIVTRAMQKRI